MKIPDFISSQHSKINLVFLKVTETDLLNAVDSAGFFIHLLFSYRIINQYKLTKGDWDRRITELWTRHGEMHRYCINPSGLIWAKEGNWACVALNKIYMPSGNWYLEGSGIIRGITNPHLS